MPDSPRFDDGRDGLDGASPRRDLWAEAQARAAEPSLTPLASVPEAHRHPGRWLAIAAAIALVAGVGTAVLASDDDGLKVSDQAGSTTTTAPRTLVDGGACPFGVVGDPIVLEPGHAPGSAFAGGTTEGATVVHGVLGSQPVEISVPGQVVTDLVGERVEEVELERGTAQVWLSDGFAQVRWFTGSDEPCDTFTVTVYGDDEDGNRHAAVDLAERVLLPAELAADRAAEELAGLLGDWALVETSIAGATTPADSQPFSFDAGRARWQSGCNNQSSSFTPVADETIELGLVVTTYAECGDDPTEIAVTSVMAGEAEVTWTRSGDELILRRGEAELVLGEAPESDGPLAGSQAEGDDDPPTVPLAVGDTVTPDALVGLWQLERSSIDGIPTDGDGVVLRFTTSSVGWSDPCADHEATYAIAEDGPEGPGGVTTHLDLGRVVTTSDGSCSPGETSQALVSALDDADVTAACTGQDEITLSAREASFVLRRVAASGD